MNEPLQRILKASAPLTLAGVPTGFLPWLAGDVARALVFMTGGAFPPRTHELLHRVSNTLLEKPFDADAVRRLVRARVGAPTGA